MPDRTPRPRDISRDPLPGASSSRALSARDPSACIPHGVDRVRATLAIVAFTTLAAIAAVLGSSRALAAEPGPSPEHTPQEVVEMVVDALRTNATSDDDDGIATVFRFASPGNRAATGPLERFTRMIKLGYADMLAHQSSRFDEMTVSGDKALQAVWLMAPSGAESGYAFQLGRQRGGDYDGMWMTESVLPLGEGERSGTRI